MRLSNITSALPSPRPVAIRVAIRVDSEPLPGALSQLMLGAPSGSPGSGHVPWPLQIAILINGGHRLCTVCSPSESWDWCGPGDPKTAAPREDTGTRFLEMIPGVVVSGGLVMQTECVTSPGIEVRELCGKEWVPAHWLGTQEKIRVKLGTLHCRTLVHSGEEFPGFLKSLGSRSDDRNSHRVLSVPLVGCRDLKGRVKCSHLLGETGGHWCGQCSCRGDPQGLLAWVLVPLTHDRLPEAV